MENVATSKEEYIKSWKHELDNLRIIWCQPEHKERLDYHLKEIDTLIGEIADTKNLE